jgi:hypothetical protein
MKFTFNQILITIEHTYNMGHGSLKVILKRSRSLSACTLFEKKKSYFNSLNRYLITYYHGSVMQMSFRQCLLDNGQ